MYNLIASLPQSSLLQIDQILVHQKIELLEGKNLWVVNFFFKNTIYLFLLEIICNQLSVNGCMIIKHFSSFSSAIIGFETNNQYEIKNSMGQQIYHAKEQNDCCTRNCCGALRSFELKITDNMDQEVIRLVRPFRCTSCCCPCCLQEVVTLTTV